MTVGVILSSSYIQDGLLAEFGLIPPSFLPLGNRRLYCQQVRMLRKFCDHIVLTVPFDFELPKRDVKALAELGVEISPGDPSKTISQALLHSIAQIDDTHDGIIVVYGDTLFDGLDDIPHDAYGAHFAIDQYKWEPAPIVSQDTSEAISGLVVSGLFSFSSIAHLRQSLIAQNTNIIDVMRRYSKIKPLRMLTTGNWYDFGHTRTYYISCGYLTTQRSFNSLNITQKYAEKQSKDRAKMAAEANWFESLPPLMRIYAPTYLGRAEYNAQQIGYRTANTYLSTLSNLASFGKLNDNAWNTVFAACKEFLDAEKSVPAPSGENFDSAAYYQPKTEQRLQLFAETFNFDINSPISVNGKKVPSPTDMAVLASDIIATDAEPVPVLIHGDFCFSNIFFDFRSRLVKVIDPRGISPDGKTTVYGDPRYDIAKLSHSALGWYDAIISGDMQAQRIGRDFDLDIGKDVIETWSSVKAAFEKGDIVTSDVARRVNHAIMVHLFLSMLPLHADNPGRQTAFLANAGRLFLELESF